VHWQGHIYGLDEDILTCLDAETGQRKWKDGRYGYGQLLLASGHLIILSGEGELALVKAAPDRFQEIARFPVIHGKSWNHLAIADGKLLVRNSAEMACFQIGL
jgi:outer membrane protein assembly factor BamB